VLAALSRVPGGGWRIQPADDAGAPTAAAFPVPDPAGVAAVEHEHGPRWLWDSASAIYPELLRAGVRVQRVVDLTQQERVLIGRAGRYGEPASTAAQLARRDGRPAPPDAPPPAGAEPGLFDDPGPNVPAPDTEDLLAAFRDQQQRLPAAAGSPAGESIDVDPAALRLLLAAESASALVASEMGHVGMPWDADVHSDVLSDLLGPRPAVGERPAGMARLAEEIRAAFGHPVNPDSATDLRAAFRRAGFDIDSTRSWTLRQLDHPAVGPALAYKEMHRLFTANGWNWLDQWVRDGRFRAEYVAGGVVSGRWATRGGGALQIPKVVRRAVVADPGHSLVVADAAQLEPRVLIAVSGDERLGALAAADDLYAALADVGFAGRRENAKMALLGAMYGATSGAAGRLLGTLFQQFPVAMDHVERAARRGEQGRLVSSVLGRASNRPGASWWAAVDRGAASDATPAEEQRGRQTARAWGRFTRNFVIQGSAADWAAVWLSCLRRDLTAQVPEAELVFFQHDELMVHVSDADAAQVAGLVAATAAEAGRLVFPRAAPGWRVPVRPAVVRCYADAK
jgi:DNA polymerase-1